MTDRQILVDQLIHDEGFRTHPYMDSVGKITIGVGRNLSDHGLSSREVLELLDHDLDEAITDLAGAFPWFATLDVVRQRVMVNMRFNLGPTRFREFKRLLRAMAAQNYPLAAQAMRDSLWAQQTTRRADRLIARMRSGVEA